MTPLVALQDVKDWLGGTPGTAFPSGSDPVLVRIIGSISNFVTAYLNGPVAPATFSEVYNGTGRKVLWLRQQPVLSVRSLSVDSTTFAARVGPTGSGYVFDSTSVSMHESCFWHGLQNVQVTYDAGYQTTDPVIVEANTDNPPAGSVKASDLSRPWNSDRGLAYANGSALTLVSGAPAQGQYQVTQDSKGYGLYLLNALDIGAAVVVTYGYTPEDIGQAVLEFVSERYKNRNRIGEVSQNFKGTVVSFSQKDMNATIKTLLAPYRNVVPIA